MFRANVIRINAKIHKIVIAPATGLAVHIIFKCKFECNANRMYEITFNNKLKMN